MTDHLDRIVVVLVATTLVVSLVLLTQTVQTRTESAEVIERRTEQIMDALNRIIDDELLREDRIERRVEHRQLMDAIQELDR